MRDAIYVNESCHTHEGDEVCCSLLLWVAVCCNMLQCVAVCCSVLQCVVLEGNAGRISRCDTTHVHASCNTHESEEVR